MKRFWLSWIQPTEDHRPLTYPPGPGVLGWWCSGDCQEGATLCALVEAEDEEDADKTIRADWPEKATFRFIDEAEPDWLPNDRFPLSDWMKERLEKHL